ncbi:MAG: 30S ribosomal protein S16 [Armatimonadetes bacterium]|nr:30S ribosomal protein S16 [Armatimonadota bacterium]
MPVRMRLKRFGSKGNPHYRIVLADSRAPRDGKTIEEIGYYDPKPDPAEVRIDVDRAVYWLMCGAQPTRTVRSLLRKAGVLARLAEVRREQKGSETAEQATEPEALAETSETDAVAEGAAAEAGAETSTEE